MQESEFEFADFIYYTPSGMDKEWQLWPLRAGRNVAKPDYRVGPRRIECYSLHFVLDGAIRVEYGDGRVDLRRGDLFCLYPGKSYCYYRLSPEHEPPLQLRWLALDGPKVKSLLELTGLTSEAPFLHNAYNTSVEETLERLYEALKAVATVRTALSLELQSLLLKLLAQLIPDVASDKQTASDGYGWIRRCVDYMELHALEGITVQQVAHYAGLHRSYFSDTFARQVGVPPADYLRQIRMNKAKQLLLDTDASVSEIALTIGYPNLYSFTRAFKQYFQISPSAYRRNSSHL
ncbi:AraC family transcriptional regulator [Paenibacillus koleovorans]|uniref:AraC family transcriptional regulator n=1 Tax=Paenibacillus koleovorans TaxID=121608 RepID=UPI000FDA8875|nr:AraC family transcriptional regulator [Paenibacillus koleovorans]